MASTLVHTVTIAAGADKIYEAISTGQGLASFWTKDSQAEPRVGSIAKFGFGGPRLELKVAELTPAKLVRWVSHEVFPDWAGTTILWEIASAENGRSEVTFSHSGWPEDLPQAKLGSVNYTWGRVVGRLKKHAETGDVVPYFP
jgi:uncharacterized protein YndB with AHSA1/START domain